MARSSFVEEATSVEVLPDINLLGELYDRRPLPRLDGYNMTYLKAGASCAFRAADEYQGPIAAFWARGLGRVAALAAQADGDWGRTFIAWPHYGDFFVTLTRYLQGEGAPGLYVASRRHGSEGVVTVEVDDEDPAALKRLKGAELIDLNEDGAAAGMQILQKEAGLYEARFPAFGERGKRGLLAILTHLLEAAAESFSAGCGEDSASMGTFAGERSFAGGKVQGSGAGVASGLPPVRPRGRPHPDAGRDASGLTVGPRRELSPASGFAPSVARAVADSGTGNGVSKESDSISSLRIDVAEIVGCAVDLLNVDLFLCTPLARIIHESPTAAARKCQWQRRTGEFDPQRVLEHASGQIHPSPCPRTLRPASLRSLMNNPGLGVPTSSLSRSGVGLRK